MNKNQINVTSIGFYDLVDSSANRGTDGTFFGRLSHIYQSL